MVFIGIDPGVSGGIAVLEDDGRVVGVAKMPPTDADLLAYLRVHRDARAVVERVAPFSRPGSLMGATSAFTFGRGFGAIQMALTAAAIPFDLVVPRRWQPMMGVVYPKGSTQTERKNRSKARAQQLFPDLSPTHATADALLIAEYCRRFHRGSVVDPSARTHDVEKEKEDREAKPRRVGKGRKRQAKRRAQAEV